jgi:DNA helicase-2/ATP-dependent DNA helicase PcrA
VFTLFETAKSWSQANPSLTVAGFLKRIGYYRKYSLSLPSKRLSELPGRVKVLTAHQSKGLEYEAVFIPGISEGNWGGRRNVDQLRLPSGAVLKDGSASIAADAEEEERRLFFVGITRAKAKLFLSYCESDGNKMKIASQFLTELGIEPSRNLEAVDYARVIAAELRPTALFASEMTEGEEAYVREFLQNYRLSPSDLSKFLEDPKLFLRDSIFKYPFEDNEYTVFGKTYHRALELFYLSWKKEGREPGIEPLLSDFERALKQEILPPEIREKLLKKGREGLAGWYAIHAGKLEIPLELEYNFYPRNVVFDGIPLTGKIDKIELVPGSADEVRLVDYKTGRAKSLNEVKGLTANSDGKYFRQLLFYKLLFELDASLSSKYRPTSLTLEFVEGKDGDYRSVEVDFTDEEYERLKSEIRDAWSKISDPEFWKETMRG